MFPKPQTFLQKRGSAKTFVLLTNPCDLQKLFRIYRTSQPSPLPHSMVTGSLDFRAFSGGLSAMCELPTAYLHPLSSSITTISLESHRQMCYSKNRKRESHRSGLPSKQFTPARCAGRQLFAVVGGYFRFPLKIV